MPTGRMRTAPTAATPIMVDDRRKVEDAGDFSRNNFFPDQTIDGVHLNAQVTSPDMTANRRCSFPTARRTSCWSPMQRRAGHLRLFPSARPRCDGWGPLLVS